ncbi:nucleoside triphosphate pyrophosphohydrolase [Marinomonas sp. M1K-6]|uniref:Nucleoside triphosphate pyrophosphohydrolase n=1 Tax=Marinomonas profundi TaxID=2726122 RepID=A0A847R308_9GAMM|nr:nucleoside triphosphate pyrophosphohydrolase [Marinomonas profundi]NLQ18232.1 nucleoside triphosphate pyrophosphohydrolase [Marinomonas profundi]UDV03584.1 nucleoside triphosphate pyrophosphohydrolase [Marinomonas profundi]
MSTTIAQLQYVMACLRDSEFGCAWDKKQDYKSIAPYTLEEAYEVLDAIEREDFEHLKEELGDLLFQVIFYAQMAEEEQRFSFDDVVAGIVEKMLRRHPHVFPDGDIARFGEPTRLTEQQIAEQWQRIKAQEKGASSDSLLDAVPVSMPALMQAVKIQQKVAKVGFDWPDAAPVFAKIREELDELEAAIKEQNRLHVEEEMGDVLFAVSNLARHLNVAPDVALNKTNIKFRRRFGRIEALVSAQNKKLTDCSLEELDRYWDQAKREGL